VAVDEDGSGRIGVETLGRQCAAHVPEIIASWAQIVYI
jgi:hypothetical protein